MFDSHAHYEDKRYDKDRESVLQKVLQSGVGYVVNVGSDIKTSKQSITLSNDYPFVYATVGVHPHYAENITQADLATLEQLAGKPKVVAIGEIGLDYYYDNSPRDIQRYWFEQQLTLAQRLNMPVVIHTRKAIEDTLKIVQASRVKGVFHCFSESAEIAEQVVKMGFYISFGGTLTYKNARHAVEAAKVTPLDKIIIETDCPYLPPEGHRGERNDSSLMRLVCEKLADIKGVSFEEAAHATFENAKRVYNTIS
ncbi:MAG: TatD family hydrolase, partial [Clostridiaceae bacterium]|nr:TatD family hydrolase [Clostridiaceae bacterium]